MEVQHELVFKDFGKNLKFFQNVRKIAQNKVEGAILEKVVADKFPGNLILLYIYPTHDILGSGKVSW